MKHDGHHDSLSKTTVQGTLEGGRRRFWHRKCSVQFSSVPCPMRSSGGHEGRFSRDPLPVFSAGGPCGQFWRGQGCPFFDVIYPAFPLPTTASSTLQRALKDGFGEAVVVTIMFQGASPSLSPFATARRLNCICVTRYFQFC